MRWLAVSMLLAAGCGGSESTTADAALPRLVVQPLQINLPEGMLGTIAVKLDVAPAAPVDVTVSFGPELGGSPTTLRFDAADFGAAQTVSFSSPQDEDFDNESTMVTFTSPLGTVVVRVDIRDDDSAVTGPGCRALGGTCVPGKWARCPAGTEPTADVHADCKPPTATRGYFCCVPAPPSPCSDSGATNCFDTSCHSCWGPATALSCESGRVCCNYQCTD